MNIGACPSKRGEGALRYLVIRMLSCAAPRPVHTRNLGTT